MHTFAPLHRMGQAPSDPTSTILMRKSSTPLTSVLPMLLKGYYVGALTALMAVLSDVLIIFLGAVPLSPGQDPLELLVATYTCFAVLGAMVVSVGVMIYWKHGLPDLARAPDTIISVMSYVAHSGRLLEKMEGMEYLDDRDLAGRINRLGKKYVYGKGLATDGTYRHLVDEEMKM
jgi:hypothetical protein